jgi:hypothetical protein
MAMAEESIGKEMPVSSSVNVHGKTEIDNLVRIRIKRVKLIMGGTSAGC